LKTRSSLVAEPLLNNWLFIYFSKDIFEKAFANDYSLICKNDIFFTKTLRYSKFLFILYQCVHSIESKTVDKWFSCQIFVHFMLFFLYFSIFFFSLSLSSPYNDISFSSESIKLSIMRIKILFRGRKKSGNTEKFSNFRRKKNWLKFKSNECKEKLIVIYLMQVFWGIELLFLITAQVNIFTVDFCSSLQIGSNKVIIIMKPIINKWWITIIITELVKEKIVISQKFIVFFQFQVQ
jgi:hypothetical protein